MSQLRKVSRAGMEVQRPAGHPREHRYTRCQARSTRSYFNAVQHHDGTELLRRRDRVMRRQTQAPGLSFTLGEFRTKLPWGVWDEEPQPDISTSSSASLRRLRANTQDVRSEMMELAGDESGRVQVDSLGAQGFTSEDLSRVIYDKFKDQELPDFLDDIGLERKGGLDRIKDIWSPEKYFWFVFLIASVTFNVGYLLAMDWMIFEHILQDIFERQMTSAWQAPSAMMQASSQTAVVFEHISDPHVKWWLLRVAAMVATWEVCWLIVKAFHALYIWWLFFMDRSEYKSFHAAAYFFQKLLPQCSTFSAIKLMAHVHPSLIYNEYLCFISSSSWRGTMAGLVAVSIYFLLKCGASAFAALGAFTIKVLAVSMKLQNPDYSVLYKLGSIAALMNQCMGCVIMEVVLQDRLFLFVFGGQEANYEDRGIAYKNVYECRMAKQIWEEFWMKGHRLKALVLFATFDHYDLQKLLIEAMPEDRNNVLLGDEGYSRWTGLDPLEEERGAEESNPIEYEDDCYDVTNAWQARSKVPSPCATPVEQAEISLHRPSKQPPFKEKTWDSSVSSASSQGMGAVTRALRHEASWRDDL